MGDVDDRRQSDDIEHMHTLDHHGWNGSNHPEKHTNLEFHHSRV